MPSFAECVTAAVSDDEFVSNWLRLRGLSMPTTPLESLIDEATGRSLDLAALFLADVYDLIYCRTRPEPPQ